MVKSMMFPNSLLNILVSRLDRQIYNFFLGGKKILMNEGGKDASGKFDQFHKRELLGQYQHLVVGEVNKQSAAPAKKQAEVPTVKRNNKQEELFFGELVPFGDPAWYQGNHSLFYNETHRNLRKSIREFMEKNVIPYCAEWDEKKHIPRELLKQFGEYVLFGIEKLILCRAGYLPAAVGGKWPQQYVGNMSPPGNVPAEQWDAFHELILIQEMCRAGSGGVCWFLCTLAICMSQNIY